tara:strand:- start:298 stop:1008 length:711 start_codon:yes stop_codon:yes gene_type:complete
MYQYNHTRPTPHLLFDIAKGNIFNEQPLNIFGINRTVGTAYETIWDDSGSYVYPSSALIMSVVSTSAIDTMDVLVDGLDADYNVLQETVTLTGTVAVNTTSAFFRINSLVILGGENVGGISASNGGTQYAFIGTLLGVSQSSVYTVPAGHSFYLFRIDVNSATTNGNKFLYFRNVVTTNGRTIRASEATFAVSQVSYDRQVPFKIVEKSDFSFEARSSSSTNEIAIFLEGVLVKDF